jgi:hypothetical protein
MYEYMYTLYAVILNPPVIKKIQAMKIHLFFTHMCDFFVQYKYCTRVEQF